MAYVPGQKLEEEDPNKLGAPGAPAAPTGGAVGSTPSVGGSAVGSSPVAQPNGSQGGAGTGFVNIDSYLNANKGAGQAVKAAGDKALGADASAFGAANKTVADNVKAQDKPIVDPGDLAASVVDGGGNAVEQAKAIMANKFQGPSAVDYKIGNSDQMKQVAALGNAKSAGKQLATNSGTIGQYGTGLSAIDSAIYGSAGEKGNLDALNAGGLAQSTEQGTTAEATNKSATDLSAKIGKQADAQRQALIQAGSHLKKTAQEKADAANAQQLDDMTKGIVRDPNTGKVVAGAKAQDGGWEKGSGRASAANYWNAAGLSNIGAALGDTQMAATKAGPAFVSGHNTTASTQGHQTSGGEVSDMTVTKPDSLVELDGMAKTPAQRDRYMALRAKGVGQREAIQWAQDPNVPVDVANHGQIADLSVKSVKK